MDKRKLTPEQIRQVRGLIKYYPELFLCPCGRIYGSDSKEQDSLICPICISKKRDKNREKKNELASV